MTDAPMGGKGMRWRPIDITAPTEWYRNKAWRWGDSCWIVAAAFCPTVLSFGGQILTGYGKGFGLHFGPLWIGIAANFKGEK